MKKWILPALLTGGLALLLWWLVSKPGALTSLTRILQPVDPNAVLGTALCEAGVIAYGGMTAGMSGLPLCSALGPALGPVVKGVSDLAVNTLDGAGDVVGSIVSLHTGAIEGAKDVAVDTYHSAKDVVGDVYHSTKDVVGDIYGGVGTVVSSAEDVVGDVYGAGKTVVKDVYNTGKDIVLAPVTITKKIFSTIGGWF